MLYKGNASSIFLQNVSTSQSLWLSFVREKLTAVKTSSNASELRKILSRLKEVQEKLETSDQTSLASKFPDINDTLSIIEGNQTEFSDTVLQTLGPMQTATQDGFRAMEERIYSLEAKKPIRESWDQMEVKWRCRHRAD